MGYSGQTPPGGFCSTGTIENEQWLGFIAYDTVATFTLNAINCANGNGVQLAIYTSCNSAPVACYPGATGGAAVPINLTVSMTPGVNYFLMIDGFAGDQCSFSLTVNPASAVSAPTVGPTGPLSGPAGVCPGGSFTFSIPPVSGAGYYQWNAPPGWLIDGQAPPVYRIAPTGHSVQVTPDGTAGDICVQPLNSFYQGTQVCQSVGIVPPINTTTLQVNGFSGSCLLTGGLPQMNGSNYAGVVMALQGNPAVTATLTQAPFTHGDTVYFTAPQPGVYQLIATDANGCSSAATVVVSNNTGGTAGQSAGGCWQWQNPLPQGNALYTVYFADEQTGWTVGNKGTILKTADGGQTWATQVSGTGSHLIGVVFAADKQTGWASGYDGVILKTVDGGETWIRQPSGTTKHLNYIWFVDQQTGWAVGENGTILKTSDGGASWIPQTSGVNEYLNCVYFVDNQNGWAVGALFTTLRTTDGGQTWSKHTSGVQTLYHVYFTDSQTGWASGGNGIIMHTTDGGQTWSPQPKVTNNPLYCIHFTDSQTGWASGVGGTILRTLNGGQTWAVQTSGTVNFLSGIYSTDGQTAWSVGDNGVILKTTNGGTNWFNLGSGITNTIESIFFADAQTGWAAGAGGLILKTQNGGQNWFTQNSGTVASLRAVYFTDPQTGWAAGEGGTIVKTANGGFSWAPQNTPSTQALSELFFTGPQTGWAAGANGTILKTPDGGLNWNLQSSGASAELAAVFFADAQTGWVAGAGGVILKSTDGGLTWSPQTSGTTAFLHDLFFADSQTGWAAGANGVILKTENGGQTWTAQTSGTTAQLSALYFTDSQTGRVAGASGLVLFTTDGGQNWTIRDAGTTNALRDIWFSDAQTGWVAGQNGTILHYSAAPPVCVSAIPLHQQTAVDTLTAIAWPPVSGCTDGYRLSLGTTSGGSELLNQQDVGLNTFYQPTQPLPAGDTIFVRATAYNAIGEAGGCQEYWFVTQYSVCPPPNFPAPVIDCADAPVLCQSLDGYCNNLGNHAIPFSPFPGCPGFTISNPSWFAFFAGSTEITLRITPSNCGNGPQPGMQGGIYASCIAQPMDLQCLCTTAPFLLSANNFVVGQKYYLLLDGCQYDSCDYSIEVLSGSTIATPLCVSGLNLPGHQAVNTPSSTAIQWPAVSGCLSGYRLSLGLTPGGAELLNNLTVTDTFYQPAQPLPAGDTVYVRIVPFSQTGNATGCEEYWFVTESNCLVVNTTADSGPGSLREAINCANANPGPDTIRFNIPGVGPHVIFLKSVLPDIGDASTVINGTTQPGYFLGIITINGDSLANEPLIRITGSNCTIKGLHLKNSNYGNGVDGIRVVFAGGTQIVSNLITTCRMGIVIGNGAGSAFVEGNIIGTDTSGMNNLGMSLHGISCLISSNNNVIRRNLIAYNNWTGLNINQNSHQNRISQNILYCNGNTSLPAIYLDNGNQNYPVPTILLAGLTQITGSSNPGDTIEVFINNDTGCAGEPCQGKIFLGTAVANASGKWILSAPFEAPLLIGGMVTATATDSNNNTSAFAGCVSVTCPLTPPACAHPDSALFNGLVAWLPFDGHVCDVSGNNNNGTANGGFSYTTDRFGNPGGAGNFNAANSYVAAPSSNSLNSPTTSITLAGWAKANLPVPQLHGFLTKISDFSIQYRMGVAPDADNPAKTNFYFGTDFNSTLAELTGDFNAQQWNHYAVTWNGTEVRFFLNGTQVGTANPFSGTIVPSTSTNLEIGRDIHGGDEWTDGALDDLRVYNRALSPNEVKLLAGIYAEVSDTLVCSGETVTLSSTIPNANNYTWWHLESNAIAGTSATATAAVSADATFELTAAVDTCTFKDTVYVKVDPLAQNFTGLGPDIVLCESRPVQFTVSTPPGCNGCTFLWNDGETDTILTATPTGSTLYAVTVTNAAGCTVADSVLVTIDNQSINCGLVALYRFDGDAKDASGNNNHGTPTGSFNWSRDRFGNCESAIHLNGIFQKGWVKVPNSPTLQFNAAKQMTAALWVELDALAGMSGFGNYAPNGVHILLAKAGDGIATPDGFYQNLNGVNGDLWYSGGSSSGTMNISASVHPNYSKTWKHLALVISPDSIKLYVDGILTAQNVSNTDFSAADAEDLYLGIMGGPGAAQPYWYPLQGSLDDVRLYNRALSAAEINQLFQLPNPGPEVTIEPEMPVICSGDTITLTASGGGSYQWSDGGPATAQWAIAPLTNKTYTVSVTDAEGCTRVDSVRVSLDTNCGLIAHYPLDGNAQDSSGNNHHGAPFKTVGAEDRFGNCGQALGFYQCAGDLVSGTDGSHVILPDLIRDTMPAFSITLWVKDDSLCYSHGEAYIFFGNENPGNNPSGKRSVQIAHYGNAGPVDSLYWTVSKSAIVTAPFLPSDRNRFVFYGLVYENGVLKAYKDNQLVGQATGQVSMDSGGSGLARHWWTSSSTRFIGEIDDVRIYNRALSPAEISDLYNLPGSGPNLPAAALSAAKTSLCPGESVALRAAPVKPGFTYAWYRDGNLLSGATDTAYVATQPGVYQVRVSDAAGCDSLSAPLTLTVAMAVTAAIATPNGSVLTCAQPALTLQASGGDTYAWSGNLGANAAATVTAPGSYSVTVTNSTTGCSATATATVSQNTSIPNAAATGGVLTCADPVTILFGSSTTPGATYAWTGPNGFVFNGPNPPVNTVGAYTLTVTDPANGCKATATATAVGDNSLPQAAITAPAGTQLNCTNTALTLQAPAPGGYAYEWSGGLGNGASATVTQPGAYTVTVTNQANGCTATSSVTVTQSSAQPNVSASGGQLTCAQTFVILNGASTTPGVTFLWNGPNGFSAAQAKPPVNVAGTYTLTVTNPQNGCSATTTAVVTQNSALPAVTLATPNGTTVTCAQPFVSLQASAPGQVTYAWSGPGGFTFSGPNPPVTAGGTYVVTVTNTTNGCTNMASATVTLNNTPPAAAINLPNGAQLTCAQPTVVLEVLGGDSQSWAGPNGFTFSGPAPTVNTPGIYTVTVTNASNACTAAINVTVTQNKTLPNAVAAGGAITCLQPSVDLVGISATPGATWLWSGPGGFTSSQQNPTVNMGGTYVLTVTNPLNGCTATATATVQQNQTPPAVALTLPNGNQLTCAQPAVVLQASAPGPMAYAWSGPAGFSFNGPTPAVNAAGIYTVTVTNQVSGCTATATAAVSENKIPPAAAIATPGGQSITCVQPLVTLQGSGGGTYAWAGPNGYQFSGPNAAVNVAGTYTLTVTNPANGCTATATTAVSENKTPPAATVSPANAQLTCGQPSAPLQAGGGGSYSWAGPNGFSFLGPNPQVTAAGVYTVTVSNPLNGCTATATVTVSANQTPPDVNAAGGQLSCQTGAVILPGGSNTPGATFVWTGPGGFTFNGPTPAVTLPGVYTLTVTNPQNNCTAMRQVTVTPAPVLSPQVSGSTQLCPGGARTLTAAPGFSTYLWSTGANTPAITVSQTGAYTVSVTDAAQCTGSTTVIVTLAVPPAPVIAGPNKLCDGSSITLDAGNGYAQYAWSTGQNTQTIAVSVASTYSVTVTDANGCTGTAATTIGLVAAPNPGAGSNSPLCAGEQLKLFAGSGASWKYAWLGPAGYNSQQQNPVRNNATAAMSGLYRLTVTDNNNCTGTASVAVEVSSDYLTETDTVVCAGNTLLNGKPVKNDTTIQRLYQSVAGCDSLVILDVTVVGENSIRAAPDYTVLLGDETSITINVTANDTLRANWTLGIAQPPGNGTAQALNRDEIRYTRTQGAGPDVFQYLLCAADYCPDLCDTASVYVRVLDGDSKTNAFAPESEYVENRVFDPLTELNAGADPGNEILPDDLIFVVFNRWGEIVHEASPYEAWDGRQNKRILPQGAYYFRLYLARGDERELLREGAVYLLR